MLAQIGQMVQINDKLIPAVNIQVENVPGFLTSEVDGSVVWYGVYFEIMFEDGGLWVVDQGTNESDLETVFIEVFDNWGKDQDLDNMTQKYQLPNWDRFLELYDARVSFHLKDVA
jgi:hypothetical protein